MYLFNISDFENVKKFEKKLNEVIVEYYYEMNMSIFLDYYNFLIYFVIIYGLNIWFGGRGFVEVLKENKKYKIKYLFFEIVFVNYKII